MKVRPFTEKDLEEVILWFDWEHFYYDTPNPTTISDNEVRDILTYDCSYFLIMEEKGQAVGLSDFIIDRIGKYLEFEFKFKRGYSDLPRCQLFLDFILNYFFTNYDINCVVKYVYDFDQSYKEFFRDSQLTCEGSYRQHIYKDGKYHDVLIYSILRKEWRKSHSKGEVEFEGYFEADKV